MLMRSIIRQYSTNAKMVYFGNNSPHKLTHFLKLDPLINRDGILFLSPKPYSLSKGEFDG